jgi:caffeoyl-CoA O-methyltransferase
MVMSEQYEEYIRYLFVEEDNALENIRSATESNGLPVINVQAHEGHLLGWLTRMVNARLAVEIGCLGGYSGTWIARSLPEDGKLYTVEVSSKHAEVARSNFENAGVGHKVEVIQGAALDVLHQLEPVGPFDLVFIDADKLNYPAYLTWSVDNLRAGGLVAAHNAFYHGAVLQPKNDDQQGMVAFNEALADDPRLDSFIIPLGDGMAVARKL